MTPGRREGGRQRDLSRSRSLAAGSRRNVHIDGGHATVGDGAADGAGQGEAGVEIEAGRGAGGVGLRTLDGGVNLGHGGGWLGAGEDWRV